MRVYVFGRLISSRASRGFDMALVAVNGPRRIN